MKLFIETIGLQTPRGRLLFALVLSIVIFLYNPAQWPVQLSIWSLLGIPSPSIGLTRAYYEVLHLRFIDAWELNALIYVVVAIGCLVLVRDIKRMMQALNISRASNSS